MELADALGRVFVDQVLFICGLAHHWVLELRILRPAGHWLSAAWAN